MEEQLRSEKSEGIYIYSTHPIPPLKDVPLLLKQSDPTPVTEVSDFHLLKQMLREVTCGCVVFDVKEAGHLKQLAEVSHAMRSEISAGIFQFIVLCQLEHPKLEAILNKLNCNKVLYPPYSVKALKIAVVRHMAIAKKSSAYGDRSSHEIKVSGSDKLRKSSEASHQKAVREVDPLKTLDDCWLTKASIARSIHGKWLCFAIGPGPVTGVWTEVKSETVGRRFDDRVWEWKPKDAEKDLFIREGSWRFRGRLPEFKDTSWTFVGATPELSYYKNGVLIERKIFSETNGDLVFACNSKAALDKLPDIQASIDFEVYLKRSGGKSSLLEYVEKRKSERDLSATVEAVDSKELELQLEKELERASKDYVATEEEKTGLEFKDSEVPPAERPFGDGKFGEKTIDPARLAVFKKAEPFFKPRSRLFQIVPSDRGKWSRIQDACQAQSSVILWTEKRQMKELTAVISAGDDKDQVRIAYPKFISKEQIQSELSSRNAHQLYLNINTRSTAIFFVQKLDKIQFTEEFIDVEIPTIIYEVQRREFLRHPVPPSSSLIVTIGLASDQMTAITGFGKDISVGGAQIEHVLSDSKGSRRARALEVGAVFPNLSFEIYGKPIHCSAQLRWKKEVAGHGDSPGKILLGVQFVKISAEDREGIRLYVMEESFDFIESILNSKEVQTEVQTEEKIESLQEASESGS